jgi:hypothetical protein
MFIADFVQGASGIECTWMQLHVGICELLWQASADIGLVHSTITDSLGRCVFCERV